MGEVLKGLIGDFVEVYLDDIVIYSYDLEEHLIHIEKVVERLHRSGLTCQPKKCHFGQTQISFLGHIVYADGIDKQPEKPFLESRTFELYTVNSALTWLQRAKDKNSKLFRWALQLGTLDFVIRHVPGVQNEGPDMLSRFPTDGPTLDEDALEKNLVGFPTSNIVVGSREPEQIYHIHPNSSNSSPISLQTLIDWQGEDPKIKEIMSNFTSHSPACNTRLNRLEKFDNLIYEEGLLKKRKKPTQQWEVVSVDLMGPYPRTSRGKTNILVATDCHSRWVEEYPFGAATSTVITQTLERELFVRFGYPRVLLNDNGPQFTSDVWTKALDRWGVEGWTTPVYHPRANPVERRNQELKKGLRALLVNDSHRSWDQKLSAVLFTLRNWKNDRTGVSPLVSVFGHETKSPGDWALIVKSDSTPRVPATSDIITVAEKSKENRRAFAAGDQAFMSREGEEHLAGRDSRWRPSRGHMRSSLEDLVWQTTSQLDILRQTRATLIGLGAEFPPDAPQGLSVQQIGDVGRAREGCTGESTGTDGPSAHTGASPPHTADGPEGDHGEATTAAGTPITTGTRSTGTSAGQCPTTGAQTSQPATTPEAANRPAAATAGNCPTTGTAANRPTADTAANRPTTNAADGCPTAGPAAKRSTTDTATASSPDPGTAAGNSGGRYSPGGDPERRRGCLSAPPLQRSCHTNQWWWAVTTSLSISRPYTGNSLGKWETGW
ncbi:uncharacterized protein K02A2.6-like [Aphis gossypii]|uniref:uncharacterized protein K02A2.6-like n=1 Tax=Aphis gossypii TaxID=80765 RepID=UPI002158D140|nr:uncharacterized protein K02A2.6-like [Aphis gossypii]